MSVTHRFSQLGMQTQSSSSSLLNVAVTSLADSPPLQLDRRLLDYLSIEMVPTLTEAAQARLEKTEAEIQRLEKGVEVETPASALASAEARKKMQRERLVQETRRRVEGIGYKIGWILAERLTCDRPPFPKSQNQPSGQAEPLDLVKFLCRDLWQYLYHKQIDNLRTNHRGVFVLHDHHCIPLSRFACAGAEGEVAQMAEMMVSAAHAPCGVVRGALACLGLVTTVSPELGQTLSSCAFQIKIIK